KAEGFWGFVRRHHINVIVLSPELRSDPSYRDDPAFKEFIAGKWLEDFELFAVPNLPAQLSMQIAVRRDALPAEWHGRGRHAASGGCEPPGTGPGSSTEPGGLHPPLANNASRN